jgi:hypothetical protein
MMSMIGFAPRPETDVLPTCSIVALVPSRAGASRRRIASNCAGQLGSYGTTRLASVGRWRLFGGKGSSHLASRPDGIYPVEVIEVEDVEEFGAGRRLTASPEPASISSKVRCGR